MPSLYLCLSLSKSSDYQFCVWFQGAYTSGDWESKKDELCFSTFKFTITHTRLKLHDDKREKSTEKESTEDEVDSDNDTG